MSVRVREATSTAGRVYRFGHGQTANGLVKHVLPEIRGKLQTRAFCGTVIVYFGAHQRYPLCGSCLRELDRLGVPMT